MHALTYSMQCLLAQYAYSMLKHVFFFAKQGQCTPSVWLMLNPHSHLQIIGFQGYDVNWVFCLLMGTQPATLPLEFHKFQVHNTAARYVVLEHYRVHAKTSIRLKDLIMVFADQNVHVNTDRSLEATTTALKSQA
jgi:hypothetical protein